MKVLVTNKKLRKALETERERKKAFGTDMAKKISMRIAALDAADSLADFWPPKGLPERCHELQGDLAGTFSMDLKHPFRLLFKPVINEGESDKEHNSANSPQQLDASSEQERWKAIKTVDITGIEDTHG